MVVVVGIFLALSGLVFLDNLSFLISATARALKAVLLIQIRPRLTLAEALARG